MMRACAIACLALACHRAPTRRAELLARLPATPQVVFVADGEQLATPVLRRAVDVLRAHVPPTTSCVIDAALASDAVAVAASRDAGALIVLAARAPAHCAALSQVGDELWIATLGAAAPVARQASLTSAPRWARARAILDEAPLGLAVDLGDRRALAALRAEPLDGWLAIDADPAVAPALARAATGLFARWAITAPALAAAAHKLAITTRGDQLLVRATALDADDAVALASALADLVDPAPPAAARPSVPCPAQSVVRCVDGTHFEVSSLAAALAQMTAPGEPFVAGGAPAGVRLTADAALLLRRGDVVLGVGNRAVRSADELAAALAAAGAPPAAHAAVAIRRAGAEIVLDLTETGIRQ